MVLTYKDGTKKKGEAYLAIDSSRLGSHIIKFTID